MSHVARNHSYFKWIYNKELAAPVCEEEICLCLETKLLKPFSFLEWFLTFQAGLKVLTKLHLCLLMRKAGIEKTVFYFCMFSFILSSPPNRHPTSRIIFPQHQYLLLCWPCQFGQTIPQRDPSVPPTTSISPVSVIPATALDIVLSTVSPPVL